MAGQYWSPLSQIVSGASAGMPLTTTYWYPPSGLNCAEPLVKVAAVAGSEGGYNPCINAIAVFPRTSPFLSHN